MTSFIHYFHPLMRIMRERQQFLLSNKLPDFIQDNLLETVPTLYDTAESFNYLVLDFETTGLDVDNDLILSIGWVEIIDSQIDLASCKHLYINSKLQINPVTAVINHITPQMLNEGDAIHDAIKALFSASKNKILVAHGCLVEAQFLQKYMLRNFGLSRLPLLWLDTLSIEKHMAMSVNNPDIDLTLAATRERYNLPQYNSHNALADAVSTAELFLAQQKKLQPQNKMRFAQLYKMSQ
ncbi:3'-5' exonuclease [Shewanella inventionis]|uniref:DNA polymerase III subunit epsilon n=1 Tax=Shewanella inventionis TaxID=1738770 RepID=A0ABQ1ITV5_9GAMM|nr:3'-5' exonuclease [Shewanella inventionis]MCL1158338.1 3'-5' exonuclease [Shewanella inventionis]UAL41838.1 3'-5' exonuclease [Shewanella inventionis]GGB51942.1 DNA polymerase III subunit epsilon [Shewanella inventionis]